MATEHLLKLASVYSGHTGLTLATVSTYAADAGVFFKNIQAGSSCTLKRYQRVLRWFSENWPSDLEWPSDIPRPMAQPSTKGAA
ncbi:hypothetical protein KZZ07_19755 [Mameliella sp. CS4]|uniref:hypothetical protein n=1 Tax=Mameliella sp. CS4 TaxID=2862329 RepID=UPI001C5E1CF5|nr:hypothetical protein [Mameliella sp. CS4]MBW4984780.1 hypothetical protein [Mameliella sp. CS4]